MTRPPKPDPVPAIIAEIDRITPLLAGVGSDPSATHGELTSSDMQLALEALAKLRAKLHALTKK